MLSKAWLALALILFCACLDAQIDSLAWEPDSLKTKITTKLDIERWLDAQKVKEQAVSAPLHSDLGDYYQSGYFHLARPDLKLPLRHGFAQLSSVFSAGLYNNSFRNFYPQVSYYHSADYTVEPYPFEPSLSSIDASLGDYEHHYALVNFAKASLLSYPGLSYQGTLLVQNGQWSDIMAAQTSMKHYVDLQTGNWKVEGEFASWAKDIAMSELLPVYWLPNNYSIAHSIKQSYLSVQCPLGKISVMNSSESATATQFAQTLKQKTTQLQYAWGQNRGNLSYEVLYEHAWRKSNTDFSGSFDTDSYEDKLALSIDNYMPIGLSVKAEYLDFLRGKVFADLSIPVFGSYLGAFGNLLLGSDASPVVVKDIYSLNGELELLDIRVPREQGVYFRHEWQGISSSIAVGSKRMVQQAESAGFDLDYEQPFVRLAFDIEQAWRSWELIAKPKWIYSKFNDGLCENPEFRFNSEQNLIYHLPYNNSILAGFRVHSHSGYYAANVVSPYLIEASTVLDAWGGFNIDRWFELRAGFKNILSSSLYGVYPAPLSAFAQLKWYYLN